MALMAVNSTDGICYHLSMERVLQCWQEVAKKKQVFLLQPDVCALIYAKNDKRGSYCGIFHDLPEKQSFNATEWLARRALPGPGSRVRLIL